MTPDWSQLDRELAAWRDLGLCLPLWWRDDDATEPTPALKRLSQMSARLGLPVHLAVIPARAQQALADRMAPGLIPVVHGWSHVSHAPPGEKKAEFGAHRPVAHLRADASRGLDRLRGLFGKRLGTMFVPPWNRVSDTLLPQLAGLGFTSVSTFTPRRAPQCAPGLARINTHLDPIAWRAGRGLVDPQILIAQVADQLADRREGRADNSEPYGVLTHHLVHDDGTWTFTESLLSRLLAGPAHPWTAAETGEPNEPT
ncbi:polysaccharide deacetylase family protein [Rhodobacteraceae bacterium F11138]|nr:polysaccharide deacetylase family protein [Rhodobacteraceae bacterium F11138]